MVCCRCPCCYHWRDEPEVQQNGIDCPKTLAGRADAINAPASEADTESLTGSESGSETSAVPKTLGSGTSSVTGSLWDSLFFPPAFFCTQAHDEMPTEEDTLTEEEDPDACEEEEEFLTPHCLYTSSKGKNIVRKPSGGLCDVSESRRLVKTKSSARQCEPEREVSAKLEIVDVAQVMDKQPSEKKPDFNGKWKCVATWGLSEFLGACGYSRLKIAAAQRAPWPSWEFTQLGDSFVFVNVGAFGALREDFVANGTLYEAVDGWKQVSTCKAFWEGSTLVVEKRSPQGDFREERYIDGEGNLQFTLRALGEVKGSWGRTFQRT